VRAHVVVDLGFGDAGKGLVTDLLVRTTGARLVVRYNGGAQAGHNVVAPDGRHHTFAQLGAGTFVDGVRTFLSRHVVLHPTALLVEAAALEAKGVAAPLARVGISELARIVTPFHQAAGRLREIARGAARHGSCGVGVGETVSDGLRHPDEVVRAGDLRDRPRLVGLAARARERLRAEVEALAPSRASPEVRVFDDPGVLEAWVGQAVRVAPAVMAEEALAQWAALTPAVVFEGAQGVLLDESIGFHPYTSWSRCTSANADAEITGLRCVDAVERIGVLRAYAVRHGPGPLPTETDALRAAITEHNGWGPWQGAVRYGWFDAVLARYALDAIGGVDRLVLTHVDAARRLAGWRTCDGYALTPADDERDLVGEASAGIVRRLATGTDGGLARQERRTSLLTRGVPRLDDCGASVAAVVARTESLLGRAVDLVSLGPAAADVVERSALAAPAAHLAASS
jgi:adenylosuccinate synthase